MELGVGRGWRDQGIEDELGRRERGMLGQQDRGGWGDKEKANFVGM